MTIPRQGERDRAAEQQACDKRTSLIGEQALEYLVSPKVCSSSRSGVCGRIVSG